MEVVKFGIQFYQFLQKCYGYTRRHFKSLGTTNPTTNNRSSRLSSKWVSSHLKETFHNGANETQQSIVENDTDAVPFVFASGTNNSYYVDPKLTDANQLTMMWSTHS